MPESPVWLRSKNRHEEADRSTEWLKLPPPSVPANEKWEMEMKEVNKSDEKQPKKSIYFTRPILMPLMIGLSLLVLQQISGIDAIIFFTVEIFKASGKTLDHCVRSKEEHVGECRFNRFEYVLIGFAQEKFQVEFAATQSDASM